MAKAHTEARTEQGPAARAAYRDRIITDPQFLVGKPVVKGTRIPVELVLQRLAENPDLDELFADYPRLTVADVKACLAYAQALVERRRPQKGAKAASSLRPAV